MRFVLLFLIILFISGCSSKKLNVQLPVDSSVSFSNSGTASFPDEWWQSFNSHTLNVLVDSALNNNFDLYAAWYRLQAAEAVVDRESATFFPSLSASLQGNRGRTLTQFSQNEQFRFNLTAEYEVDLWGRIRSQVDAEKYRAQATRADFQTAALTISAELTSTWFQLVAARKQLHLVNEQININENSLQSLKIRFGNGQIRGVDILRQQQLLESTREQKTLIETNIRLLSHQLAVLSGENPLYAFDTTTMKLPDLPPLPETGIPVELIQNRPDVQQAYYRLQASDRDLATAISSRYPRLTFSGSVYSSAENAENLFKNWAHNLAGNLMAPLFYGGELNAEVDRNEALKNQQLYNYGQVVLTAFMEVEDALIREVKQQERIAFLEQQHTLTRKAYEQLKLSYFNGVSGYLDVLIAQDEEQQLQRELISAHLTLLEYRIALYRALASGFDTELENINEDFKE